MKYFSYLILIIIMYSGTTLLALPKAAVISVPTSHDSINALSYTAAAGIENIIEKTGRLFLVSANSMISDESQEKISVNQLIKGARDQQAAIVVIISVYQRGVVSYGEVKIMALDPSFAEYNGGARVQSRIMQNIPVLLQREFVRQISSFPLIFSATPMNNSSSTIEVGTYSGLVSGKSYSLENGTTFRVTTTGRYQSIVDKPLSGDNLRIEKFPDVRSIDNILALQIDNNINRQFGAEHTYLKGARVDQKYLESLVVVNPLGNIIIPGYGSYLTTGYLGFENPVPSFASMGACASLYFFELLYVPGKSGFKANFFPWVQDSDKSDRDVRVQQYLWTMIPFTFTAGYLDQLSLQYQHDSVLPPGGNNPYVTALHGAIVPGGGFFYKGHRFWGWSYFGAEFCTGFYAASEWGSDNGEYALYGLGILKAMDIVHSLLIRPSYDFYTREKYDTTDLRISFDVQTGASGEPQIYAGVGRSF